MKATRANRRASFSGARLALTLRVIYRDIKKTRASHRFVSQQLALARTCLAGAELLRVEECLSLLRKPESSLRPSEKAPALFHAEMPFQGRGAGMLLSNEHNSPIESYSAQRTCLLLTLLCLK